LSQTSIYGLNHVYRKMLSYLYDRGTRWRSWLRHCAPRVRFLMVSLEFFIDTILQVALWPLGWLSP